MNLSAKLESFLTAESLALIRLIKTEAERLDLPLYLVGGSVRDLLLGREIKDFDLTVEGDAARLAEAILRKYAGKVVFHSRFGTATWTLDETTFKRLSVPMVGASSFPPFLDFISARSETYLQPGALPTVKRSTIDDDLRRRDFTINAMALRLDGKYWGQLHDPLSGQADLEQKLIRVIHSRSFVDDPTRMFRAIRYAFRYDFNIEHQTSSLVNPESRTILSQLSGERLRHEFDLIFQEPKPLQTLAAVEEWGLTKAIHPFMADCHAMALSHLQEPSPEFGGFVVPEILSLRQTLGWILYLMRLSETEIGTIAKRLAFPVLLTRLVTVASALENHSNSYKEWKPSQWTFYLDDMPKLSIYAVYLVRKEPALKEYLTRWQNIKPVTNGDDLQKRGFEPGPRFAEILRQLRAAWLDGEVRTRAEEIAILEKMNHGR